MGDESDNIAEKGVSLFLSHAVEIGVNFSPGLVTIVLLYANQIMGYLSKSGLEEGLSLVEIAEDVTTPEMFVVAVLAGIFAQLGYEAVKNR